MDRHELFAGVNRVKAPAGFEAGVLARLPAARKERARRAMTYRYAFAGSAALVLAAFLFFNPSGVDKGSVLSYAEREALSATPETGARRGSRLVPVYETMDYASEYRNVRPQPRTVYILEQVSETVSSEIIY
jgi:hypothetical protein